MEKQDKDKWYKGVEQESMGQENERQYSEQTSMVKELSRKWSKRSIRKWKCYTRIRYEQNKNQRLIVDANV